MGFVPHDSENLSLTKVYQGTEYYRRPRQVALDAFACRCPSLRPLFGNPTARSSHIAPYTFMKGSSLNAKAIATSEGIDCLNQRTRATQLTSRIPSKAQSCFGWTPPYAKSSSRRGSSPTMSLCRSEHGRGQVGLFLICYASR